MPQRSLPDATAYRLSLMHCYLGEIVHAEPDTKITSKVLAEALDLREETVRRDISFVGSVGRPGAGYRAQDLFQAIQVFLGLEDQYPVIRVGSAEMLRALQVVFPAQAYGVKPVAYFSEHPEDVGVVIDGVSIQHVSDIPELDRSLNVDVALIACSPSWVQLLVDQCHKAGLTGILLLTPALTLNKPKGMNISQIRMPCDIKSLACRCKPQPGGGTFDD